MARKKMSATNRRRVGDVMRAARKRKPTGRKVKFTTEEKSTLRDVMKSQHSGSRKKSAAPKRKRSTVRKGVQRLKGKRTHIARHKGVRGRKAGFKHSAATRAKMSKSHKARHRKAGHKAKR